MIGCADSPSPQPTASGEWRYDRTVEDGHTRVRTISGSIWGDRARLVQVAAIGTKRRIETEAALCS